MKKLIAICLVLVSINMTAQQMRIQKIKELRQETVILEAHLHDADTSYFLMYRDMQYDYIINYGSIYFKNRTELMTAFADMQTITGAPKGTEYMIPTVDGATFMTATLVGQVVVFVSSKDKATTKLAAKEVQKLQKAFLQWESPISH